MRKFILITAVLLISSSAFAGPTTRGLSTSEPAKSAAAVEVAPSQEGAKPSVADQLKALGETSKAEKPAPKVEQAAAPLPAIEVKEPVSKSAKDANQRDAHAELKPSQRSKTAKKVRRESDERKARRYAGYFGIRW